MLVPGLTVRRAWLGSVRRISWLSAARNSDPAARLQVDVALVGWTIRWRRGRPSVVLRAHGVRVHVPRAWLAAPRSSARPPTRPAIPADARPAKALKKAADEPALALPRVVARLLPFLGWVELEVDALVVVEDVLTLSTTLRAGVHSLPISTTSPNPKAAAWLSLSKLLIRELAPTATTTTRSTKQQPPAKSAWPAISILEPVVVRAEAPLQLKPGVGGAALAVAFGRGAEGVHVRVHELKRILRSFEAIERERKANSPDSDVEKHPDEDRKSVV